MKKPKMMYIEAQKKQFAPLNKAALIKLPKTLFIAYSIQYEPLAAQISAELKHSGYDIIGCEQVLGCTKLPQRNRNVPILLVGSGRFHALNLALQVNAPIYIYEAGKISQISQSDTASLEAKRKAALVKLLSADRIGILVSTKSGQNKMKEALALKKHLESRAKKVFLFVSNTIDLRELENFKIDAWVNTACPGLARDSPKIANIRDLADLSGIKP